MKEPTLADVHGLSDAEARAKYLAAGWPVVPASTGGNGIMLGAGVVGLAIASPAGVEALERLERTYGALPRAPRRSGWDPQIRLFRVDPSRVFRTVMHLHGHAKDVHVLGSKRELVLPPSLERHTYHQWADVCATQRLDFLSVPFLPRWLRELLDDRAAGLAQRRQIVIPAKDLAACSDMGNAERYIRDHGSEVRWCPGWDSWLVWDGRRWAKDDDGEAMRRAMVTARKISDEAEKARDGEDRKALADHALASESFAKLSAMLNTAKNHQGITISPAALDADEWTLCVTNGLLDLRTGELRPHDPEALCSKLAPIAWDPDADMTEWESFISTALKGDADVIAFVQRAVGYSLTGSTREQRYFFVHGRGATGKSTFVEAIKAMLGDYARTADTSTFMDTGRPHASGAPQPEIVRLAGARFVPCTEVEEGARLAVGVVKKITGGDTVTVRDMYAKPFEFTPGFKVWMVANTAPKVSDRDDAIFRRVLRIPFDNIIPAAQRDPELRKRLVDPAVSGPAILRWAVQGVHDWLQSGLRVPEVIEAATQDYRDAQDPLRAFWELCEFGAELTTPRKTLREAYEKWNRAEGTSHALSPKAFATRVRERIESLQGNGHKADTTVRVAWSTSPVDAWRGIAVKIVHDDGQGYEGEQFPV